MLDPSTAAKIFKNVATAYYAGAVQAATSSVAGDENPEVSTSGRPGKLDPAVVDAMAAGIEAVCLYIRSLPVLTQVNGSAITPAGPIPVTGVGRIFP
jgi:hypothetical protein